MKRLIGFVLAAFLVTAAPALGAESKVGYVDLQKALNFSLAGKAAKEQISKTVKEYEGQVTARQAEMQDLKAELEKQAMLLSEDARSTKERDYQQKLKDFQRFTKDIQEELQQRDADHTRRILDSLFGVLKELGEKEGYDLILEKTESSILYADERVDLTEKLTRAFDEKFNAEGGK